MPANYVNGFPYSSVSPYATAQQQSASVGSGRQRAGGTTYFVSSILGTDGNAGTNMQLPLATTTQALKVVNPGDTVVYLPGHSETMTAAGSVSVNVSGILFVGLGVGVIRPTFKYGTSTAATFDIVKDNCTFYNCRWDMTGKSGLVLGMNVKTAANDVTFDSCEFLQSNATNACATAILTDASANNLKINNCRFVQFGAGTAMTAALAIVGGDGFQLTNSFLNGLYNVSAGILANNTTAMTNYIIRGNVFINQTASATKVVVMQAGSVGIIAQNLIGIGSGAAPFTSAAGWWTGNWSAAAVATNGTLV